MCYRLWCLGLISFYLATVFCIHFKAQSLIQGPQEIITFILDYEKYWQALVVDVCVGYILMIIMKESVSFMTCTFQRVTTWKHYQYKSNLCQPFTVKCSKQRTAAIYNIKL